MNTPTTPQRTRLRATSTLLAATLTFLAVATLAARAQYAGDPPNRVARIAYSRGNVSLEPAGSDSFSAAPVNYPLSQGDRLYADLNALSELQTSGLAVRLGSGADLTITSLTDAVAQFALAQGSVRVRTRELYAPEGEQASVELDTPNATILVQQPGDIRVDTYPQDGTTLVTVNAGAVEVSGDGFDQVIGANQSLRLSGVSPVYAEYIGLLPPDDLDQFDGGRERQRQQSVAFRQHYVDPEMIGAGDLDQYGDWQPTSQYGAIWFPRNVDPDWSPYSRGHWAVIPPWGYTWVDDEPWGFAPFHYGRWNNFGGRWGWVPGPPPSVFEGREFGGRPPRPVYSPALVAFVGGPGFTLSLSFGGHSGEGVTAWFPLGPSEPYVPWYYTSPAYVNRVNVTNIYTTNVTEVHNTYINKSVTVYNVTNVTYVNRNTATVAVAQNDFARGHAITPTQTVRLDANATRQLAQAPVVQRAIVTPPRTVTPPSAAPARAVPAVAARPVVQTSQGFQRAGAPPAAAPLRPPTPPPATAAVRAAMPVPRTPTVISPAVTSPARPIAGAPGAAAPLAPNRPGATPVATPGRPGPAPVTAPTSGAAPGRPVGAPSAAPIQRQPPTSAPPIQIQNRPPAATNPTPPTNQLRPPTPAPIQRQAPAPAPPPVRPTAPPPAPANQTHPLSPAPPPQNRPAPTPPVNQTRPAPAPAQPRPYPAPPTQLNQSNPPSRPTPARPAPTPAPNPAFNSAPRQTVSPASRPAQAPAPARVPPPMPAQQPRPETNPAPRPAQPRSAPPRATIPPPQNPHPAPAAAPKSQTPQPPNRNPNDKPKDEKPN